MKTQGENAQPDGAKAPFTDEPQAPLTGLLAVGESGTDAGGLAGLGADLPGAAAGARLRSGVVITIAVVAVAVGTLFLMRKYGLGGGLQFVPVKIDYPVDAGAQPLARDPQRERVMQDLESSGKIVQVPLDKLQCNPFELEPDHTGPVAAPTDDGSAERDRARREQESLTRTIDATYAALQLHSVLTGAVPIARISGQAVRVGDRVGGDVFTVRAIHGRTVDLEPVAMPGKIYTLSLGEK